MKVGFIGLGTMGASMASNTLTGGYDLVVHDINRDAAAPHLEAGATWADSPREVAATSEVVSPRCPVHRRWKQSPWGKMAYYTASAKGRSTSI